MAISWASGDDGVKVTTVPSLIRKQDLYNVHAWKDPLLFDAKVIAENDFLSARN